MATTLYGNFPLLLPNKTVSVSLYGLQKTSGTILFQPGQEGAALTLAEQEGSVFPDPQVRTTDMGLLEMSFDAYRDTGAKTGVFSSEVLNFSKTFQPTVASVSSPPWTITEVWITDSYVERKVFPANVTSWFIQPATFTLYSKMLSRSITGGRPSYANDATTLTLTWATQVSSVTRRNFGTFDEVDIVTSLNATLA